MAPAVDAVFNKWTAEILWVLIHGGRQRFGELRGRLPMVTAKVLAQRLRQLERDGLVLRTYYAEVPPRVEYEATEPAQALAPVFAALGTWAEENSAQIEAARAAYA